MQSHIEKLAYEIEWWVQIDKEDFMHEINQCEFKMDGQDEGRDDREASFKRLCKRQLGASKETDTGQRPEILESWRALC